MSLRCCRHFICLCACASITEPDPPKVIIAMTCEPSQGPACRYLCRFPFLVRDRTTGHCERDQRRYGEQRLPFSTFKKVVVRHGPRDRCGSPGLDPGAVRDGGEKGQRIRITGRGAVPRRWTDRGWIPDRRSMGNAGKRRRLLRLRAVQRSRRGEPNRTEDHHDLAGVRPG